MASQPDDGIAFSVAHQQERFTLLELPNEVLEIVTAQDAPPLYMKSLGLAKDGQDEQTLAKSSNAVLCTHSKTFDLRQTQTSNSLHVLQPRYVPSENSDLPVEGLAAIAQCRSILEVIPSSTSPHQYLRDVLPLWPGPVDLIKRSKKEIFANLPYSDGELRRAWRDMVAFEVDECAMRPRGASLLALWRNILNTATAEGVDLTGAFNATFLYENLDSGDQNYEVPLDLFNNLLVCMIDPTTDDKRDAVTWDSTYSAQQTSARFVGELVLELSVERTGSCSSQQLIEEWRRHLPEAWKKYAQLELIQDRYTERAGGLISLQDPTRTVFITALAETAPVSENANTSKSRKWHEKFSKTRR